MRRTALRAAALIAASLVLVGCASGDPEERGPQGPNGYTLSASFSDGSVLWWDRSPESGLTDIIMQDPEGRMVASCLGTAPLLCVEGPDEAYGVLLIAPDGAASATMEWFGQEVPLTRGEVGLVEAGGSAPPVFAGVMPPFTPEGGYRVEVFDEAGTSIWTS